MSAAVFYIDWQDVQISGFTPNTYTDAVVNGNSAVSQGVELEFRGSLTENTSFVAGYAYTDAKLSEAIDNAVVSAESGTKLPGTAEHMYTLGLDYNQALTDGMSLKYHFDGAYTSEVTNDVEVTSPTFREFNGYETINANLTLSTDQWTATLFGSNLTDEAGISAQRGHIHATSQVEWLRRPRTVGLRVGYTF